MSAVNPKGALNVTRRTWDKEEYALRAAERDSNVAFEGDVKAEDDLDAKLYAKADAEAAGPAGSERKFLKAREFKLNVDAKVGQMKVVNTTTGTDTSAYYCKLCDCSLKDSLAWLDHINGKKRTCHTAAPPSL